MPRAEYAGKGSGNCVLAAGLTVHGRDTEVSLTDVAARDRSGTECNSFRTSGRCVPYFDSGEEHQ